MLARSTVANGVMINPGCTFLLQPIWTVPDHSGMAGTVPERMVCDSWYFAIASAAGKVLASAIIASNRGSL